MRRWAYRLGQRLGSGMAGQRAQLDDWQRAAQDRRAGFGSPDDLRAMADQRQAVDATARQVEDQRRAQADILRSYESRTVPRGCVDPRCNDPRCQR